MGTYVFTKKQFMEQMDKFVKDDEVLVFTTTPYGQTSGASKKIPAKRIGFAFASDAFKDADHIHDIMQSKVAAMIVGKPEILAQNFQDEIAKDKEEKQQVKKE